MKKILTAGLLAIAVIAMSQQQASAWICARLGAGVNLGWQSGDNCFGWFGMWHNGPFPDGSGHHHHAHNQGPWQPPVYLPYVWAGHGHGSHYPRPVFDTMSMAPNQYAYPAYPAPTFYYYQPMSFEFGR